MGERDTEIRTLTDLLQCLQSEQRVSELYVLRTFYHLLSVIIITICQKLPTIVSNFQRLVNPSLPINTGRVPLTGKAESSALGLNSYCPVSTSFRYSVDTGYLQIIYWLQTMRHYEVIIYKSSQIIVI